MKKILLFVCTFILLPCMAAAEELVAETDVDEVVYGEPITLSVTYQGDDGGNLQPDFSVLQKEFRIYSNSSSLQSTYINGNFSQIRVWKLGLFPLKDGEVIIPEINVGKNKTKPIKVNVLPAGSTVKPKNSEAKAKQSDEIKASLSVEVDALSAYVQQEVNADVVIKDYAGIGLQAEPQFENTTDWIIKSLGQPEIIKNKDGSRDIVFHYALFPQKSGKQQIPVVNVEAYYVIYDNGMQQPMMFGNSMFQMMTADFGGMFGEQRPLYLRSKPIEMNVKPIVAEYGDNWWLPAEALVLDGKWTDRKDDLKVGDAIIREIQLTAYGIADTQLPELKVPETPDFKIYPEKPRLSSTVNQGKILSQAVYRVVYIPQKSGKLRVPEFGLRWFNVNTQKIENAVVPAEIISVGKNAQLQELEKKESSVQPEANDVKISENKQADIPEKSLDMRLVMVMICLSFVLGVIVCYVIFFFNNNKKQKEFNVKHLSLIRDYVKKHDYRNLQEELLAWAQIYLPNQKINNLNDLAKQINNADFSEQMQILNRILYAGAAENLSDADKIVVPLKEKQKSSKRNKNSKKALPELYE
ncbi:MAG: BatD family protein [Alphaproteobacteria bacterium]|nr:BatD family protein [Alphaproteobacteria bacterium]